MNGHSKVIVNGNAPSTERPNQLDGESNTTNAKARLADSGINIKLSTAFKRFFTVFDSLNIFENTACASSTSCSCNDSCNNSNCCCSNNYCNCNNDDNNHTVVNNTNKNNVNASTALVSTSDCMSKILECNNENDTNALYNSQPSTSNASLMQRQRQYKYSIY